MKNRLVVNGKDIYYSDVKSNIDDLYGEDFYSFSNRVAESYYNELCCVNEVFSSVVQHYLALDFFIQNKNFDHIDVIHANSETKLYLFDIARKYNIPISGRSFLEKLKISIFCFVVRLASFGYLLFLMAKIPYDNNGIRISDKFAVLRQKSAIQKFNKFEEIDKEYENPYHSNSVYRLFPIGKRLYWVIKAYRKSFSFYRQMKSFYEPLLGKNSVYQLYRFYQKRIVHAFLYEFLIDNYFSYFKGKTYFTGSNLDRFSVIEERLAIKHHIDTVCIPHGLEYGYLFPKGYSCNHFYATSEFAANYLNKLYNTKKFLYDENVVTKMFGLSNAIKHEKKVIFFTEQQEYYINKSIILKIGPKLKSSGVKLYIKLHPGDTRAHYKGCNYDFITDYTLSLSHNICVSRKSTILLEAIYNNSIPIAILTTERDKSIFNTFPSLQSDKIIKTYSVEELYDTIIKYL